MIAIVVRVSLALAVASAVTTATVAQVQRRPSGQQKPAVKIDASLQVGTARYVSSASGECQHAPVASIYSVVSEMFRIEQRDGTSALTMTLWRPKDGSEPMVNLSVDVSGNREEVQTVKAPGRGQTTRGSGTVALERSGPAGTFRVTGKSAKGTAITGTIKCSAFTAAVAEGGTPNPGPEP